MAILRVWRGGLDKLTLTLISAIYIIIAFTVTSVFIKLIKSLSKEEYNEQEKDK